MTTAIATTSIAANKTIAAVTSLPPPAAVFASTHIPPVIVAYTPPFVTNAVAPPPLREIIITYFNDCSCGISYWVIRNNGAGSDCNNLHLVDGQTQPIPSNIATTLIVSDKELDIGMGFTSPPLPSWGLNEKDKKEYIVSPFVAVASPEATEAVVASAAANPKEYVGFKKAFNDHIRGGCGSDNRGSVNSNDVVVI